MATSTDVHPSPARGEPSPTTGESSNHVVSPELSTSRHLGVLGIGLIIEEVGKGARLVSSHSAPSINNQYPPQQFRYPASPPPFFLNSSHVPTGGQAPSNMKGSGNQTLRGKKKDNKNDNGPSSNNNSSNPSNIDLFFDLPARVLSKLFRPKRPLCGKPLTLNVSGTTFCCRAELFDSQPSTIGGEGSNHPLVLFSVIVALAPLAPSTTEETQSVPLASNNLYSPNTNPQIRSDSAFTTISRVHRNLARLCHVLTREEVRCRYVSRQCAMLIQIRHEYESNAGPDCISLSDGSGTNTSAGGTDTSSNKKGEPPGPPPLSPKEKRTSIPPPSKPKPKDKKKMNVSDDEVQKPEMSRSQRREYVQNLIEIMLAASPPVDKSHNDDQFEGYEVHGNLARELAQVFHCISSPSSNLSFLSRATAQEGVVYINRHIAVPLDPVLDNSPVISVTDSMSIQQSTKISPSHTLLFPNSSPSEILKGLLDEYNELTTSPSISNSLRRILPHIQPRRSLHEIAWDAGLPLPHVMDTARWLVHSGMCVTAMPVLRKNHYVCAGGVVERMAKLALPFWQTFGVKSQHCKFYWKSDTINSSLADHDDDDDDSVHRRMTASIGAPHIFVIVSALTKKENGIQSPTLGEAIALLSGSESKSDILSPHHTRNDSFPYLGDHRHLSRQTSSGVANTMREHASVTGRALSSAEIVYSMACWLIANKVIVELKDTSIENKYGNKQATAALEESLYNED